MTTWKEKIKNQFKTTIPEDYETEFDICMKCGRRLADKKYSTLKAHQEKMHKLPRRKKAKEMAFKYPLIVYPLIIVIAIPVVMIGVPTILDYTLTPLLDYLYPERVEERINAEKCSEDLKAFKQNLYELGQFDTGHADEFNRLLQECNVNFFAFTQDPPIFEQEDYAP